MNRQMIEVEADLADALHPLLGLDTPGKTLRGSLPRSVVGPTGARAGISPMGEIRYIRESGPRILSGRTSNTKRRSAPHPRRRERVEPRHPAAARRRPRRA